MSKYASLICYPLLGVVLFLSGCAIEPINSEPPRPVIPGAPEWVNKGNTTLNTNEGRLFHGVSSTGPRGDLALQKSIADERAVIETAKVISGFIETVSIDFLNNSTRYLEHDDDEDEVFRKIDEESARNIRTLVTHRVEEALARYFKDPVTKQFKDKLNKRVNDDAARYIKAATQYQVDFSRQLEDFIARQMREAVADQIRNAHKIDTSGARVIANWRDPRTNIIWSVAEMEMKQVKSFVEEEKNMNAELKSFFGANADNIFDRLIRERDNPNPFAVR